MVQPCRSLVKIETKSGSNKMIIIGRDYWVLITGAGQCRNISYSCLTEIILWTFMWQCIDHITFKPSCINVGPVLRSR